MRRMLPLLLPAVASILLGTGCRGPLPRIHYAPLELRPPAEQIPEVESFEPFLEEKGRLIDALLAIDTLVDGDKGRESARNAYLKLFHEAKPLAESAAKTSGAYGAGLEILGLLRKEGFVYDGQRDGLPFRYASVTSCLNSKRGICLSFTMLTMALLDSCGLEAWSASYPRHILVRVRNAGKEFELESTIFGDPAGMDHPADLAARAAREGYVYCRSLDREESAWLYLAERLWRWAPRRNRDTRSFRLLERVELKLNGSDNSMSTQWALRQHWRSNDAMLGAGDRAEARRLAIEEYERLIRWDPDDPLAYLLLSLCHQSAGDRRSELLTLRRFMDTGPDAESPVSRITQARWWIRRRNVDIDEFRLTPEERKRGDDFLRKYYPDSDPAARADAELWKLLEVTDR